MNHPLNNFFDKIFVIFIERNKQRLEAFLNDNPDLEVEVFPGIDGRELFPSIEYVANFPLSFFASHQLAYNRCKIWNKGQLGCAMSNLFVQKEIVKRNLQRVLVLEDDAYLLKHLLSSFDQAATELSSDWELFYLGYKSPSKWGERLWSRLMLRIKYFFTPLVIQGMSSADNHKQFLPSSFSRNLNIPGIYAGTHAYALSYEGAKKIIAIDTPLQYGFDTTLMHANYHKLIKSYSLKRPLFVPNPNFETSLIN